MRGVWRRVWRRMCVRAGSVSSVFASGATWLSCLVVEHASVGLGVFARAQRVVDLPPWFPYPWAQVMVVRIFGLALGLLARTTPLSTTAALCCMAAVVARAVVLLVPPLELAAV